ncbi:MAG: DUF2336 domain-containing protein [Pseudomonadota bacterium]
MADPIPLITEKNGGRARRTLMRRLIDYVSIPGSNVPHQDRAMAGDILLEILFHANDEDRAHCSRRLAVMKDAPRRLLRYLAQCSFEVAQPVLEENEAFDASDLCQIVERVTTQHRMAMAGRKIVQPALTDKLAEFGEPSVLEALVKNPGAKLSEHALDILVTRSRKHERLCYFLIKRTDLRPSQAMILFWWANGDTRRDILRRFAADRLEMIEMCGDVFAMAAEEKWADPVARKALQLIERRQRNRAAINKSPYDSLEHAVSTAAANGMDPDLAQEIGYLAGVKPVTIAKIMSDHGGEGLAVLCKATGLKKRPLAQLWKALKRPLKMETGELHPLFAYTLDTYDLLTVAKAQTSLRYWNWSLSSSFSPSATKRAIMDEQANDESDFSASRRTAKLVFEN